MMSAICTQMHMDRLIQVLRGVDEVELARTLILAGDETWRGPRAEAVRNDLMRVHIILSDAVELAILHRSSIPNPIDPEDSHGEWVF